MMRAVIFLVAVSAVHAVYSVPFSLLPVPFDPISQDADSTVCVHQTLLSCQARFNSMLNLTSNADWSDPIALDYQLFNLYTQGVNGFLQMCNARHEFQQCLGNMYDICMSTPRFVSDGESPINAKEYVTIFRTLEFDCNGGFVQAAQNYDCIVKVWTTQEDNLKNCANAFNATVRKDPTQMCAASIALETCTRLPFQTICDAEASWWQCERTRVGLGLNQLCPQHYCQVQTSNQMRAEKSRESAVQRIFQGNSAKNAVMRSMAEKKKLRK